MTDVQQVIAAARKWSQEEQNIIGAALVGSHARGEPQEDSDIDVIILTDHRDDFLLDTFWTSRFGTAIETRRETWGVVETLRVFLDDSTEIEVSFAPLCWASAPLDAGTIEVARGGFQVIYEIGAVFSHVFPTDMASIRAILAKHGLKGEPVQMPASGMVNEAWDIGGKYVLRIIRADDAEDEAERESIVVPVVCAAGVRSPELVAFNLEKDIIDKRYTIYEKAKGELLGHITQNPSTFGALYREIGREIALLNTIPITEDLIPKLCKGSTFDALEQLQKSSNSGRVEPADAREIEKRVDKLQKLAGEKAESKLLHQDLHPWNLFTDPATHELTAIIDWGDAAYGDPAAEFASMPFAAIRPMLYGYIEAGGKPNDGFVARGILLGIALALWEARGLTEDRFMRQWWRLHPGGWNAVWPQIDSLLSEFSP